MTGAVVVMAVVVFLAGLLVGMVAAGAVLLRREDRARVLTNSASTRLGTYARRLHGLGR
jgi:CHASE1-domain containing sensor protein